VVGRWQIVGSDVWDCDHLNLEGLVTFGGLAEPERAS